MSDEKLYRLNAAAIYMRPDGRILVCERVKPRGSWQFPQGGVKSDEPPVDAAMREGMEETGLRPNELELAGEYGPYHYDYDEKNAARVFAKRNIAYAGQLQHYFLFKLKSMDSEPWLDQCEFCDFRWIKPEEMDFSAIPDFKLPVYRQLMADVFGVGKS